MSEEEDEEPRLSAATLEALHQFYKEQEEAAAKLEDGLPPEDWQLSQFWYSEETIQALSGEAVRAAAGGPIALISCPSLYRSVRAKAAPTQQVWLLEFDRRFARYGPDFVFYDYKAPEDVELQPGVALVVADPPFLAAECLANTALTVRRLAPRHIILCTGAVMEAQVKAELGLEPCSWRPTHQNNLANEFLCYASYPLDKFILSTSPPP